MIDDLDQVAVTEPEDDHVEETDVAEDGAEQFKGGPQVAIFLPSVG